MSVGQAGALFGFLNAGQDGTLSDRTFSHAGTDYSINEVFTQPVGTQRRLHFSLNKRIRQAALSDLTLVVDSDEFVLASGTLSPSGKSVSWDNSGLSWSAGTDVSLSLKAITGRPQLNSSGVGFDGNQISLIFNENLGSPSPSKSAFSITADGSPISIGNITIGNSGLLNLLSLSPLIGEDQTVELTYTDPTTGDDANAIQDTGGIDAHSFTVTVGNDSEVTLPALSTAEVLPNGAVIALTFSSNLEAFTSESSVIAGAFSVTAGGTDNRVTGITVSQNIASLSLADTVEEGQTVVVGYDRSDAGDEALAASNNDKKQVADFTTGENSVPAVTNNSTVYAPPTLTTAEVQSRGDEIYLGFSEGLEVPGTVAQALKDAFTVTVDGIERDFDDLVFFGVGDTFMKLVFTTAPVQEETAVVVSYDQSAAGASALAGKNSNQVAAFTTGAGGVVAVTNNSTVSADATLSGLAVSVPTGVGAELAAVALSPAFDPAVEAYSASVPFDKGDVVTFKPATSQTGAAVAYFDADDMALEDAGTTTSAADAGHQVNTAVGENTVKVKVTAPDKATTKTYTVTVTRELPTLSSAVVQANGTSVLLAFQANFPSGTGSLPAGAVEAFTVTADGVEREITGIAQGISEQILDVTLSTAIYKDQAVVVNYDSAAAGADAIEDKDGNAVQSFTTGEDGVDAAVNNSTQTFPTPSAPTNLSVKAGDKRVILGWDPPAATAPITRHEYRYKTTGDYPGDWEEIPNSGPGGANDGGYTVTGLTNGTAYTFQLRAANRQNQGAAAESAAVTPADTDPPTLVSGEVEASGDGAILVFDEVLDSTSSGAPPESAFTVEADGVSIAIGGVLVTGGAGNQRHVFLHSLSPVIYEGQAVTVTYTDPTAGDDAASIQDSVGNDVASFTTGEDGVPAVVNNSNVMAPVSTPTPANFTAAPGNARVALSWDPPAPDSGVTGHEYRRKEGTGSYPDAWTPIPDSGVGEANQAGFTVTAGLTNETAYTFALRAVSADGESLAAEAGPVTPTPGICGRTPQVRDEILNALSSVDDCAAVTVADLATVTELYIIRANVTALKSGDFAGLSALEEIHLRSNALSTLPPDVFSGLSALRVLILADNELSTLPPDVFSGLSGLEELTLSSNEELAPLPGTVFSGLTSLRVLILNGTGLDPVPAGLFSGLPELREIHLDGNGIEALPASLFSGLTKLEVLSLSANELGALPDGLFSGLSELTGIYLANNRLTELSPDVFSGLTKLKNIRLTGNQLRTLPDGVFAGLTDLEQLTLLDNPVILPVTVTLETVAGGQVRAKVLPGAPSDLTLPVMVENGVLSRGGETLQVARGLVAGAPVQVIRTGDGGEVTVDLVTPLPSPPSAHSGYEYVRAASGLPVAVADALEREPGVEGQLRLVDRDGNVVAFNDGATATSPAVGRLEVFHAGRWGTVCNDRFERGESVNNPEPDNTQDDEWENAAPRLACLVMGYEDGRYAGGYGQPGLPSQPLADGRLPHWSAEDTYPPGYPVPIWLDDVTFALKKVGEETYLSGQDLDDWLEVLAHQERCTYTGWGLHNCVHAEDAGLTCWNGGGQPEEAAAGGAVEPLTARFEARPAGHDGGRPFTLRLAFSEDVTVSAADMRGHALAVTGGRVAAAVRVDGRGDLWSLTVAPSGAEDVGIALAPGRECKEAGAICTEDGRQLSRGLAVIIPFLPPLTVWFEDAPGSHDGESAFTLKIAFSEDVDARGGELRNHVLAVSGGRKLSVGRAEGRKDLYEAAIRPKGDGDVTIITWLNSDPECGTAGTVCTADGRALSNSVTLVVPGPESAASGQQEPAEGENRPATGAPTINGTAQVGETLTADTSGIADDDGLEDVSFTYQWLADDTDISGATNATHTLGEADRGKAIRVRVSFTDDAGNEETLTSAATDPVAGAEPAERPDKPTGLSAAEVSHDRVIITWDDPGDSSITGYVILRRRHDTHAQGEFSTLAADTGTAEMAYTDTRVEPGKRYTYRIKAINAIGKSERSRWLHLDTPAAPAAEPNSPATGAPAINGTARVGETLSADTAGIADEDGLDNATFAYQWLADDTDISGATGSTYTLADADRGKAVRVRVSFTDDGGNAETLTSAATGAVAAAEPAEPPAKPRGLSATATHDTVTLTWDDPQDGSITGYVILRRVRENDEGGAFSELVPDTGTAATTYTDGTVAAETTYTYRIKAINQHGVSQRSRWFHIDTPEAPAPDGPAERENSPATGGPAINGAARVGETLAADTSGIADEDGLEEAAFTYQWLGDGSAIQDATANTYTLADSDEGRAVRVRVSFTDDAGNDETLTSAATAAVAARPAPLTARFPVSPFQSSRHQGDDDRPQVIVAFNQPVQSFTKTTPSVSLTGAVVRSVARHQEDGLENAWIFWLDPEGDDDLAFTLVAGQSCDGGGICTREGGMLSQGLSKTLPGPEEDEDEPDEEEDEPQPDDGQPNSPATGAPTINGTARVGETLTADTSGIADEDGLEDATFTYQWLADDADISGATGSTYTLADADRGKAVRVRVSFTDNGGNEETLTSPATDAAAAAEPSEPPAKPRGLSATATHDQVTLTWDDPGDDSITGYVILRRLRYDDPKGHFDELVADTGSAAATYTDDTVAAETSYTYRIKAINEHGVSERSRWFHIDTPAAP